MAGKVLCAPTDDLSCFACCPPIRPPGYDHADYRSSLCRLFADNRAAYLAGETPAKQMQGFWCPGLGFLDPGGRRVGCLYHPAVNQGRDLRGPTGYQEKCERESCAEARAFVLLNDHARAELMGLCQGMDPFTFSSRRLNPVMRLLALGPEVAEAAAGLQDLSLEEIRAWPWLKEVEPAMGWPLARLIAGQGGHGLRGEGIAEHLKRVRQEVRRALTPQPPTDKGSLLAGLAADEWEARFWRDLLGRGRATEGELERWRAALARVPRLKG